MYTWILIWCFGARRWQALAYLPGNSRFCLKRMRIYIYVCMCATSMACKHKWRIAHVWIISLFFIFSFRPFVRFFHFLASHLLLCLLGPLAIVVLPYNHRYGTERKGRNLSGEILHLYSNCWPPATFDRPFATFFLHINFPSNRVLNSVWCSSNTLYKIMTTPCIVYIQLYIHLYEALWPRPFITHTHASTHI